MCFNKWKDVTDVWLKDKPQMYLFLIYFLSVFSQIIDMQLLNMIQFGEQ